MPRIRGTDVDDQEKKRDNGSTEPSGKKSERRRFSLFAWLGPMLERRKVKVEPVDPTEFEEKK